MGSEYRIEFRYHENRVTRNNNDICAILLSLFSLLLNLGRVVKRKRQCLPLLGRELDEVRFMICAKNNE